MGLSNDNFLFDEERELDIYRYLCKEKLKKKREKKISDCLFKRYNDWKNYITNKYKNYEAQQLTEFSRFLNQQLRRSKILNPIIIMYFSPVISYYITYLISCFGDGTVKEQTDSISFQISPLVDIVLNMCAVAFIVFVAYKIYSQESMKNEFYEDYKEIIDEIIEKKNGDKDQLI